MPDERQTNQNVLPLEKRQDKQATGPHGTGKGQGTIDPADALSGLRSDAQEPGYRGQRAAWAVTRIAELEAALRPFLDSLDEEHGTCHDDATVDLTVTVGDCRRARFALTKSTG